MAQRTLNDGSTGDVVIRPGPPASGGGFGGGGAGSGGNRVGASGAFSGPSRKTKEARRRVKDAFLQAEEQKRIQAQVAAAQAQEQARLQTRQQALAGMLPRHYAIRAQIDQHFSNRTSQLSSTLEQEIVAARQHHTGTYSERWDLYLITKEKTEIDGLIAGKTAELAARNAGARSFDGHDPLTRTASDYLVRLDQFGAALDDGHRVWETAYTAAHESRLLSAQINLLADKSASLARHHAEQTVIWREREALWERQRQFAEQRAARVRFKQQADEDARIERVRQANTLKVPTPALAAGGMVLTPEGVRIAQEVAAVLERAVAAGIDVLGDMGRIAVKTGPVFVTAMVYSPTLGDGELTPEQRNRLLQAIGVPAQALDLYDGPELQAIADAGGMVEVENRLKLVAVAQGTAIIVASTGGEIDSRVPVVNAVLDPLTGLYTAEIPGSPSRHLQFSPDAAPQATSTGQAGLAVPEPQVQDIPPGVDLRIQDCIVCVPGLAPLYLSFDVPPMGSGIVIGTGQTAATGWWNTASQAQGAAIPTQIGEQFRGREFKSFTAFDEALWQTIAEHQVLTPQLDEVNKKRLEQGFAPYAPKNTWVGDQREFELRYQERGEFWADPFNLDKISIKTPSSAEGWPGVLPTVVPWPIQPVAGTWTPLVPPGSEHLGSTTLPIAPILPGVLPGNPAIPVLPENETFPAVDEGEIGARIPGFPGDMELPSPGLVFVGPPVELLEVGPYNELSGRSRGDGLDIDHIPSRRALEEYLLENFNDMTPRERRGYVQKAPSIAIPSEIHRKFSETYGGRNSASKRTTDASNLEQAVDKNFDAIKSGLLEAGLDEGSIEAGRERLHALHKKQGWY
ncbi:S-type pyocin domain-containing protein [Pseudomonas silesiensis]|uniref:S-type pyocin domain-containing protein n=1 Tax=Pseudomonas silesiensis TaxID=1853130 RepID=UPI0030CAB9EC